MSCLWGCSLCPEALSFFTWPLAEHIQMQKRGKQVNKFLYADEEVFKATFTLHFLIPDT